MEEQNRVTEMTMTTFSSTIQTGKCIITWSDHFKICLSIRSHNEDEIGNYMLPGDSNHTRHLPPHLHPNFSQSNNTRLPSNHTTSPHDQAKLDKKRERNRIAASKCRQRKLEKIQSLGKYVYLVSLFCASTIMDLLQKSNCIVQKRRAKKKIGSSNGSKKRSTFMYKVDAQLTDQTPPI